MATKKTASKKATQKVAKKVAKKVTKAVSPKATKKITKTVATKVTKKVATKVAKKVTKRTATKASMAASAASDGLIHGITPYKEKAREKYMNPNQTEHFRNILLAWKKGLLEEVSKTINLMQDENINHPDPNDRASQETDMSLELRSRDRERKLLKKIESTIIKVDNGDYGWCERCGIEIGVRRLEARPTADLCVDCKTLNEIKERQMI
ncbi:RNA polymerase-binding protein DksA [bacterium]|nr:RNA polymerase-binding protein DksA [bacterium]